MNAMTAVEMFPFSLLTLAADLGSNVLTVGLLALVPLGAAYWLLMRASRRPAVVPAGSTDALAGSLRQELASNFDLLRRVGEATALSTQVWQRSSDRVHLLSDSVAAQVRQTYQAIEVSNRLLAAASAYDVRGQLSIRQRRLSLWPTLEAAVRSGLQALGCEVTPALQARIRLANDATSAATTDSATEAIQIAAAPALARPFALTDAPRLTLFYGSDAVAQPTVAAVHPSAEQRPARKARRSVARTSRADGQMGLWESVA